MRRRAASCLASPSRSACLALGARRGVRVGSVASVRARGAAGASRRIARLDAGDAARRDGDARGLPVDGRVHGREHRRRPTSLKKRPDGTFDLGLALFRIGEAFGRRFGEEEIDAGRRRGDTREQRHAQIECALRVVEAIADDDPRRPLELRARARYLEGNLAFLDGAYEDAVRAYDRRSCSRPGMADARRRGRPRRGVEPRDRAPAHRGQEGRRERRRRRPTRASDASSDGRRPTRAARRTRRAAARTRSEGRRGRRPRRRARRRTAPTRARAAPRGRARRLRPSTNEDERMLDQLENAPTLQQEEAKRGRQEARARDGGQVNAPCARLRALVLFALLLAGGAAQAQAPPEVQVGVESDTVGRRRHRAPRDDRDEQRRDAVGSAARRDARVRAARAERVAVADAHQHQRQAHRTATRSRWTGRSRRTKTGTSRWDRRPSSSADAQYAARPITLHVVPAGQAPQRAAARSSSRAPSAFPFQFSPFDPWRGMIQARDTNQAPTEPDASRDRPEARARRSARAALLPARHRRQDERRRRRAGHLQRLTSTSTRAPRSLEVDDADVHDAHGRRLREAAAPQGRRGAPSRGTRRSAAARGWSSSCGAGPSFRCTRATSSIGPMSVGLARPRARRGRQAHERGAARPGEPSRRSPGRPPGYATGDVGQLLAQRPGAAATGRAGWRGRRSRRRRRASGNVPNAHRGAVARGRRVARRRRCTSSSGPSGTTRSGARGASTTSCGISRPGDVDLGELALPFWDPDAKRTTSRRPSSGRQGEPRRRRPAPAPGASQPDQETCPGLPRAARRRSRAWSRRAAPRRSTRCRSGSRASAAGPLRPSGRPWRCARRRGASSTRGEGGATSPATDLKERIVRGPRGVRGEGRAPGATPRSSRALEAATIVVHGRERARRRGRRGRRASRALGGRRGRGEERRRAPARVRGRALRARSRRRRRRPGSLAARPGRHPDAGEARMRRLARPAPRVRLRLRSGPRAADDDTGRALRVRERRRSRRAGRATRSARSRRSPTGAWSTPWRATTAGWRTRCGCASAPRCPEISGAPRRASRRPATSRSDARLTDDASRGLVGGPERGRAPPDPGGRAGGGGPCAIARARRRRPAVGGHVGGARPGGVVALGLGLFVHWLVGAHGRGSRAASPQGWRRRSSLVALVMTLAARSDRLNLREAVVVDPRGPADGRPGARGTGRRLRCPRGRAWRSSRRAGARRA